MSAWFNYTLHDLVRLQFAEIERLLYGHGNYQVVSPFTKYIVTASDWMQASEAHCKLMLNNFLLYTGKKPVCKMVMSSDGLLMVPSNPSVAWSRISGSDHGQRKLRVRNVHLRCFSLHFAFKQFYLLLISLSPSCILFWLFFLNTDLFNCVFVFLS